MLDTTHLMLTFAFMLHILHSLLHFYLVYPAGLALLYEGISKLMEALSCHCIDARPHLTYMHHPGQLLSPSSCTTRHSADDPHQQAGQGLLLSVGTLAHKQHMRMSHSFQANQRS